jgi:hypothetical protein
METTRIYFDDLVCAQERVAAHVKRYGHGSATTGLLLRLRAVYSAFCAGDPRDSRIQAEARKACRAAAALGGLSRTSYTREMAAYDAEMRQPVG